MSQIQEISLDSSNELLMAHRQIVEANKPTLIKAVKFLCGTNFLVFMKQELGMDIGNHHRVWWEMIKGRNDAVFMAPRDHGKSMALSRGYAIWRAKYDPMVRDIIILGADLDSAVENLTRMKEMIADSDTLKYLIPSNTAARKEFTNSKTEVKFSNGVRVRAKPFLSKLRGKHPQLIIMDDVLNEFNSDTREKRNIISDRFWSVVFPMKDKGQAESGLQSQIVVVGTALSKEDLYHELLYNANFDGVKQSAIVDEDRKEVLWPERYTYDDLMKQKKTMGPLKFAKEYMNQPTSEETSLFPASIFEPCKDKSLSYGGFYRGSDPVYLGVDFQVPGNLDGDYTVVLALEKGPQGEYTILNYSRFRATTLQEQLTTVESFCQRYKVVKGYLEDNLFQRIYAQEFKEKSSLPLTGHTVTRSRKNSLTDGVLAFRPILENLKLHLPYRTSEDRDKTDNLVREFNGLVYRNGKLGNVEYHDDIVMALWHAYSASRTTAFEVSWM